MMFNLLKHFDMMTCRIVLFFTFFISLQFLKYQKKIESKRKKGFFLVHEDYLESTYLSDSIDLLGDVFWNSN